MDKKTQRAPVEQEQSLEHALLTIRRTWAAQVTGFWSWGTVELDPSPLVLHDLHGEPLFYEYTVMDGKDQVGRVKTAATRWVGAPVATVEFGPRPWSPEQGTDRARKAAQALYPQGQIKNTDLVCYSYPKIGVRVDVEAEQREVSLIFDVADGSQVTRYGPDELEGQTAWSYLDNIPPWEADNRIRLWDLRDKERDAARTATPKVFARGFTSTEAEKIRETMLLPSKYRIIPLVSSRVLQYGPRCTTHDCFALYAQQTSVYWAVATGQMILDFYRWNFDQAAIAAAMGTGAGGTDNSGQVAGYQSLSNTCLVASLDLSADWAEAKAEIDANRPVKSGIPGHARACAGWQRQNLWLVGQPPKRWLRIYDPWPWNADLCQGGAVYWEDWDAVTHTNFIYVRPRTTPCS